MPPLVAPKPLRAPAVAAETGEIRSYRRVKRSLWSVAGSAQALGTPGAAAVTSAVTTSFAFGWQMARLYTGPLSSAAEPQLEEDLPGAGARR
jgi:hypothetical protein